MSTLDRVIPTHGVLFKLIDYGLIVNYRLTDFDYEKNFNNHRSDYINNIKLIFLLMSLIVTEEIDILNYRKYLNIFMKKHKLPYVSKPPDDRIDTMLCAIYYPEEFSKEMVVHSSVNVELYVPKEDIKVYAENWTNIKKLFEYFTLKLVK